MTCGPLSVFSSCSSRPDPRALLTSTSVDFQGTRPSQIYQRLLTYHVQVVFTERSRPARESILNAAREEFAAVGFDRSTVRSVAAKAGADPAMVIRYYGSKEGLFAAATNVDLALPTPGEPADLGRLLGRHFVELWEGSRSDGTLQILLRSAAASPEIAARIRAVFADQVTAWVESAPRVASEPNPQVSSDSAPPISSDSAPPISSESARPISPRTDPPISSMSLAMAIGLTTPEDRLREWLPTCSAQRFVATSWSCPRSPDSARRRSRRRWVQLSSSCWTTGCEGPASRVPLKSKVTNQQWMCTGRFTARAACTGRRRHSDGSAQRGR